MLDIDMPKVLKYLVLGIHIYKLLKSHDNAELRLNDQTCIKVSIFGLSGDDMNEAC